MKKNTENLFFVLLSVKYVTDFSFYCIFRKGPNFYGNGVHICFGEHLLQ